MSVLSIANLTRSFGSLRAVDDLSFDVAEGEILALLGPNGAGKTTTIKMIMGMLKPDGGTIRFRGEEITPLSNEYKSHIGYLPENPILYETLSGIEFIRLVGELHHLNPTVVNDKAARLMGALELAGAEKQLIRTYSKGMKQKLLLIAAILHNPDLLILDEPLTGLDANASAVFKEMIREQARQGKAVIFCSHILEVVERLVDRLIIVRQGKCLVSGTPEDVMRSAGEKSLDRVFAELTGARDAETVAKEISGIIAEGNGRTND
jgi:ABC-2 type transport system ATP-binding protein